MTDYSTKPEILIIDDDTEICETLEMILNSLGFFVRYFTNPKQGLEYFQTNKNPVTILDINMPEISGLEILEEIKKMQPKTQVLMMTGERDIQMVLTSLQSKATDFILKPFQSKSIESAVLRGLDLYQILSEKEETELLILEDLRLAGILQKKLMMPSNSDHHEWATDNVPVQFVSGDFIQLVTAPDNQTWILACDVEEHGVSSGLVVIYIATLFKEMIKNKEVASPGMVLTKLNESLCKEIGKYCVTALCAVIDHSSGECEFARAGYPFPILYPKFQRELVVFSDTMGTVLGLLPNLEFQSTKMGSQHGDILFLYSDGLLSSSDHPLISTISQMTVSEQRLSAMEEQVKTYIQYLHSSAKIKDDISYLLLKI